MADQQSPPAAVDPNPALVGHIARVFLLDGKWFDLPLTLGWPIFMMNTLHHRGVLINKCWFPEHMIRAIFVDPDSTEGDPARRLDIGDNVVPFQKPTGT